MHPEEAIDKRARNAWLFDGVDGLTLEACSVVWSEKQVPDEWESAYLFRNVNDLQIEDVEAPPSSQ